MLHKKLNKTFAFVSGTLLLAAVSFSSCDNSGGAKDAKTDSPAAKMDTPVVKKDSMPAATDSNKAKMNAGAEKMDSNTKVTPKPIHNP